MTFRPDQQPTEIIPPRKNEPEHEPKHRYDLSDDDPVFDAVG